MTPQEKEKLQQLKDKSQSIQRQINDLEYKQTIEVSLPKLRKAVGKCFKYLNSYGGDRPRWYLYVKVIAVDEKNMNFKCIEFQRTSLEIVEIKLENKFNFNGDNYFTRLGGYEEIKPSEYNRAKKSLKKFLVDKLEL